MTRSKFILILYIRRNEFKRFKNLSIFVTFHCFRIGLGTNRDYSFLLFALINKIKLYHDMIEVYINFIY